MDIHTRDMSQSLAAVSKSSSAATPVSQSKCKIGASHKPSTVWTRMGNFFTHMGHKRISGLSNLSDEIAVITQLCLRPENTEKNYYIHKSKAEGLRRLNRLEYTVADGVLDQLDLSDVIWCAASCYFYFQHEMQGAQGIKDCVKRKEWLMADQLFDRITQRVVFTRPQMFLHSLTTFITCAHLWSDELMCLEVLERVVSLGLYGAYFMECLMDEIDNMLALSDVTQARQVARALFGLLTTYQWEPFKPRDQEAVLRFIENYRLSLLPAQKKMLVVYSPLKKAFEVCTRRLLENLDNYDLLKVVEIMCQWIYRLPQSQEGLIPELSSVIHYASSLHLTQLYEDTLTKDFFRLILKMVGSDRRLVSLLGNRILHQFLDRNENIMNFDTAKVFFQDTEYAIVSDEYYSEDKEVLRAHRSYIHDALVRAALVHGKHRANLEAVYGTICLMIVEVPCGYTAAASMCLAMAIQDSAIGAKDIPPVFANHLHAMVMALMTLLCWIHNPADFLKYISGILKLRSDFAPHLNPPLHTSYNYAQHHMTWNNPVLFFENWEVRYGLWMHFRKGEKLNIPVSAMNVPDDPAGAAAMEAATMLAEPARALKAKNVPQSAPRKSTVFGGSARKSAAGEEHVNNKKGSTSSRKSTLGGGGSRKSTLGGAASLFKRKHDHDAPKEEESQMKLIAKGSHKQQKSTMFSILPESSAATPAVTRPTSNRSLTTTLSKPTFIPSAPHTSEEYAKTN